MNKLFEILLWAVVIIGTPLIFSQLTFSWEKIFRDGIENKQSLINSFPDSLWSKIKKTSNVIKTEHKESFFSYYDALLIGNYDTLSNWHQSFIDSNYNRTVKAKILKVIIDEFAFLEKAQETIKESARNHTNLLNRHPTSWILNEIDSIPISLIQISNPDTLIKP